MRSLCWLCAVVLAGGCFSKPTAVHHGDGGDDDGGGVDAPYPTAFGDFGAASPLQIAVTGGDDGPTLSADMREMFFSSERATPSGMSLRHLWVTRRADTSSGWQTPPIWLGDLGDQIDPTLMPGGLELYYFDGSYMIRKLARPSTDPGAVWHDDPDIKVPAAGPFAIGNRGLSMIAASTKVTDTTSHLIELTRSTTSVPWSAASMKTAIANMGNGETAPTLSTDGHELWWEHHPVSGGLVIYYAHRDSVTEDFSSPVPQVIPGVTAAYGDPEISADGTELYFAQLLGGDFKIFVTRRMASNAMIVDR